MIRRFLAWLRRSPWEYGTTARGSRARRHRITGEVQFVLWNAGERGHTEDYWHRMDESHWPGFQPAPTDGEGR